MTQYSSLNVKLSNSQLSKLKSAIKDETDVVLRISSNMVGNSNDDTNFLHELLLTNRQVANIRQAFANHLSADIKMSKTQLSKMIQSGGFLGRLLGPLLKTELSLIKSVIKTLAKSVLVPLGLTAAASAADAEIDKKNIPKGIMKFIRSKELRPKGLGPAVGSHHKNIITNIYRIQAYDSIMCGYFCIGFINFMFKGNNLTDYTNLFSPNDLKKKR